MAENHEFICVVTIGHPQNGTAWIRLSDISTVERREHGDVHGSFTHWVVSMKNGQVIGTTEAEFDRVAFLVSAMTSPPSLATGAV